MILSELIVKTNIDHKIISSMSINKVNGVVLNSKKANNKNIFVAVKGFKTDGHKFLEESYRNGCRDIVVEDNDLIQDKWKKDSTIILVKDSRKAIAEISNIINDHPFNKLKMIGVTGTKGKTTVTTLLHRFLSSKYRASMFSTIKKCSLRDIDRF